MAKPESPSEPFKRAVSVAVRSLAAEPELEVNFSSEPPSLKGLKARLPSPHRNLPAQDVALVRGIGDAYALRKAYHDEKINNQFRPASPEGAAAFEAAEQARVEAIGAIAMKGVAANLAAGDRGTPGAVYNIGGGSRVSVNQVLDIIGRLVGRPLNIHREETQKGDMRDTFADTSRARADLGFAPEWTLEVGLAAECDWLRLAGPAS